MFEVKPSSADVLAANEALAKVYDEFRTTENMKSFLLANSDRKFDNGWYKAGELNKISKKVNDFAFEKNASVSEVMTLRVSSGSRSSMFSGHSIMQRHPLSR